MAGDSSINVLLRLRGAGKFRKDAEGSARSVDKLGNATDRSSRGLAKWSKSGQRMQDVGGKMTRTVTAPLILGLGFATKAAVGFEKQISALGAVSGASSKQLDDLRASAMQAGADTMFSAKDAAVAQTELAKGGLTADQILRGGLKSSLALAAAGELELGQAAAYSANAMNLFAISGSDSMRVADAFATAANSTTADVNDFGMALTQTGSVSKAAGLSFNQTMVALEALAKGGVKGSDAGTSLKTSLIQLLKPTAKQAGMASDLGLKFLDAEGRMKSMADISQMLRGRLGGMTKAQRTATLATLAGTDGVRTLTSLYDAGPEKLRKWGTELNKSGSAAETARKKQDNLAGQWEQLQGSLETLGISIGTVLIPPLARLAGIATRAMNWLSDQPQAVQTAIVSFGLFAAAVGPVTFAVGSVVRGLVRMRGVLGGMKGLFRKVFSKAGVVGAEAAATSVAGNLGPQMGKRKSKLSRAGTSTGGIVGRAAGTTAATTAAAGMVGGGAAGGAGAAAAGGLGGKLAKHGGKFKSMGSLVGKRIGGGVVAGLILAGPEIVSAVRDALGITPGEGKFGQYSGGEGWGELGKDLLDAPREIATGLPGLATGGLITRSRHPSLAGMAPRGDDTVTGAQYGEFMMRRSAVRQHGVAKLKAMNEGRATPVEPLQTNRVGGGDSKRTIILQVGRRELARVVDDERADRAARR